MQVLLSFCYSNSYFLFGRYEKVDPESIKIPYPVKRSVREVKINASSRLISCTPIKLYKFWSALNPIEISGSVLPSCSPVLIPPTVMSPPLGARHSENSFFSPFDECFAINSSSKLDYLLGARPKIPLAFCVTNRFVYLWVHPIAARICSLRA